MNARAFRLLLDTKPDLSQVELAPFRAGVEKGRLFHDVETGEEVAVLRYQPGASVPPHRHDGYEYIFVLEGSQKDARGSYGPGTLVVNPPGSEHAVESPDGCVVLAIWQKPVRFQ